MSGTDEDTELRDLLVQTLDKNGVLGKIKAELRASIFLALEAQDQVKNQSPLANSKLRNFLSQPDGQTCVEVIQEFMEYFSLDYSSAVFLPESNSVNLYKSRGHLCQKLNFAEYESTSSPVLCSLLRERTISKSVNNSLNDTQMKRAKDLFSANSNMGSDSISSSSAVHVLSSLCPKFPLFLLERFVAEETSSSLSPDISSRSFMSMYEKLFSACHSVVADNQIPHTSPQVSGNYEKSEEEMIQQTVGFPGTRNEAIPNNENPKHSYSSQGGGLPDDYLKPSSHPEDSMDMTYDNFFDDDVYTKLKDSPTKFTDTRPSSSMKLPPLQHALSSSSERTSKSDWAPKDKSASLEYDKRHDMDYEDDFNTASHASVTEDVQGDSLLSSTESSIAELTEDHTVSEKDIRADYMEDVKKH